MEIPTACDYCGGPIEWRLENATDNWDFYRAYCVQPCHRSTLTQPRGGTNHGTRKVRHGEYLA
jgi:hypothetical protein